MSREDGVVEVPPKTTHRHSIREVHDFVGWNRRATIYWIGIGLVCALLGRIHP